MSNAGSALMGIGRGSGESRAMEAAKQAINSPLLELSINGAKGVLFNVTGGTDLGMYEIDEAAKVITNAVDPEANIIFGAVIDPRITGEVTVTVIATGFEGMHNPLSPRLTHQSMETNTRPVTIEPEKENTDEDGDGDWEIPTFIRKRME